jgi:hypothetical protein
MGNRLIDPDHVLVTRTIFKETDDPALINAMAKSMVDANDALKIEYRKNPSDFISRSKAAYGEKQTEAIVKLVSASKISKLSSDLSKAIDELFLTQQAKNSVQDLITNGSLQTNITTLDDLIIALKNGDLSSSDKNKILSRLFKFTTDQKQLELFAKELAKLNEVINKNAFKNEIEFAYLGLKNGQMSQYQSSLTTISNAVKRDLALSEPQAKTYANYILRPKMGDSFKLGFASQGGIRPGLKYAAGPIIRQFKWWKNFEKATAEEKRIFWTWLIGGPSNWPVVFRIMKEWGWLRGIPYAAANVGGQLAKKWVWIWVITSCVDVLGKIVVNFNKDELYLLLTDEEAFKGLVKGIVEELLDIVDPDNASFLSPAWKAVEFIMRYFSPFYSGGMGRLIGDLEERWGKQARTVRDQIERDNPDVDVNETSGGGTSAGTGTPPSTGTSTGTGIPARTGTSAGSTTSTPTSGRNRDN